MKTFKTNNIKNAHALMELLHMEKAPIDEKNTTTDWIEELFGYECTYNGQPHRRVLGFYSGVPTMIKYKYGLAYCDVCFLEELSQSEYNVLTNEIDQFFKCESGDPLHCVILVTDESCKKVSLIFQWMQENL